MNEDFSPKLPNSLRSCLWNWLIHFRTKLCQVCALNPDSWGLPCSTIPHVPTGDRGWGEHPLQLSSPGEREAKRAAQNPASQGGSNQVLQLCLSDLPCSVAFRFQFYPVLQEGECRTRDRRSGDHQEPPKCISGKKKVEGTMSLPGDTGNSRCVWPI